MDPTNVSLWVLGLAFLMIGFGLGWGLGYRKGEADEEGRYHRRR